MKISALMSPGASIAISPSSGSWSTAAVAERVTTSISGCRRASTSRSTAGRLAGSAGQRRFRHRADRDRRHHAQPLEHREHDRAVAVAFGGAQHRMDVGERGRGFAHPDVRGRLIRPQREFHRADGLAEKRQVDGCRGGVRAVARAGQRVVAAHRSGEHPEQRRRAVEAVDRLEGEFGRPLDVEAHALEGVGDVEIRDDEIGTVRVQPREHREAVGSFENLAAVEPRPLERVEFAIDVRASRSALTSIPAARMRARQRQLEHRYRSKS